MKQAKHLGLLLTTVLSSTTTAALAQTTPIIDGFYNQTAGLPLTSVTIGGGPFDLNLSLYNLGTATAQIPTLQSYSAGQLNGEWILMGGRTNGFHAFNPPGALFPSSQANKSIYVINPTTQQVWGRELPKNDLTTLQYLSISSTNSPNTQVGDKLYVVGGYGGEVIADQTFDTLTSWDLPSLVNWVKNPGTVADAEINNTFRQIQNPGLQITGGELEHTSDGSFLLSLGQTFTGSYLDPNAQQVYSETIRKFTITDDAGGLSISNPVATAAAQDYYRRRDLNIVPRIRPGAGGTLSEEFVALAGVFTPDQTDPATGVTLGGIWTVPVEIGSDGVPSMADPTASDTFRQAMNIYHSATIGLYSESTQTMHNLLLGGISYLYYDRSLNQFATDDFDPWDSNITDVSIDGQGKYSQRLLNGQYPTILNGGNPNNAFRFGGSAEFFADPTLPTYSNGVLNLDQIKPGTVLGYVYGGIMVDGPNSTPGGNFASSYIFKVSLVAVPETGLSWLSLSLLAGMFVGLKRRN